MSDNKEVQESVAVELPKFEEMEIGKLRQYAAHLRVAVEKTATKKDIIEAISRKLKDKVTPILADNTTKLKPGYARITLLADPMPEAQNFPVYLNCNGYECTIPRGKEVVVPMKVVRTLQDSKVNRRKQSLIQDEHGREKFAESTVVVPSYPFTIHDMVPGPEILSALEQNKQKTIGPRRRYRDFFGHWPKRGELTRAIEQGLIKMDDNEDLTAAERQAVADLTK